MAARDETPEEARLRLGRLVQERRQQLGLSIRAAADLGGVVRNTWASIEEGVRKTADSNWAGVQRALGWSPSSVAAVLAGGDPEVISGDAQSGYGADDEAIVKVMRSGLSESGKRKLIRILIQEREDFERARVRRISELIDWAAAGDAEPS